MHNIKKAQLGHLCHRPKKKKYKTGFRICLKQIPQPNDKDGDSVFQVHGCSKAWITPKKRGNAGFSTKLRPTSVVLSPNQIQHGGGLTGLNSVLLEAV